MKVRFQRLMAGVAAFSLLAVCAFAGDKKKNDPDAIGDRSVGDGINFYSL